MLVVISLFRICFFLIQSWNIECFLQLTHLPGCPNYWQKINIFSFFKDFLYLFLERGEGRERGREILIMRETLVGCLLHTSRLGTKPTTQACALTRNWTGNFSLYGMIPSSSQGYSIFLLYFVLLWCWFSFLLNFWQYLLGHFSHFRWIWQIKVSGGCCHHYSPPWSEPTSSCLYFCVCE